jgi:choline dehydrogenase-like flavoprotein
MPLAKVNAVIIGAGAGGGIAAKELAEAGYKVVLLERGQWNTAYDCRKDDLRNQRSSILGHPFGPDDRHPRVSVARNGSASVLLPWEGGYSNNAACVGGGTLSYGAMAWRFMPQDFRMRTTYGALEGSTLEDWPVSYDELEPYYEKAEWEIGVSGDDSQNPNKGPRRKPYPMPAQPPTREHEILEPAAKRLGLHPFPIPMLRNSVPYNGRGACMRCRWCVGFACEVDAKCGTQNTVIPTAIATGNCEIRTGAMVRRINVDDRGRASGVDYIDSNDRLQTQPADVVIVAGAAIETARLMLNSKCRQFPNGLGNRYDCVGRNLQGHTYTGAIGLFDFDTYDDVGPGASVAISNFNHGNPGLRGGAMLCNEFIRLPIQFIGTRPPGAARWGKAHKDFMRQFYRRSIAVQGPTQDMPMRENRVEVDPSVKDAWGIPVARLSGDKHPHTIEISNAMADRAEQWLKEAGAIQTWTRKAGPGLAAGQHQAGTCRMGSDPKTSVVDRYCRVHDMPNLYVMDGSVNVTNGGFNPVLTIMAVAYWASHHLVRQWKGGGVA